MTLLPSYVPRLALVFVLATLSLVAVVPGAGAAVAFRAATCGNFTEAFWPPYSMTLNKPTGTATGDLMIASISTSGWYSANSGPSGWTELASNGSSSTTYYKVASASEPSSYTFTGPSGGGNLAGGIASFSGVDPNTPIGDSQQTTSGTAAAITLPTATSTLAGSMRYSAMMSGAGVTTTFSAGLTEACDQKSGSVSSATAYEPLPTAGATATRTATRSSTGGNTAQTVIINPVPPCGGGALNLTPPTTVAFPSTTLNGMDKTLTSSAALTVNDLRGTNTGWNLSLTSTTFASGAYTLPTGAAQVTSVDATPQGSACSAPTSTVPVPVTVPAGVTAPTAAKIFNAAIGSGAGPVDLSANLSLTIPSRTHVGTYTSTWTFTLATGP